MKHKKVILSPSVNKTFNVISILSPFSPTDKLIDTLPPVRKDKGKLELKQRPASLREKVSDLGTGRQQADKLRFHFAP